MKIAAAAIRVLNQVIDYLSFLHQTGYNRFMKSSDANATTMDSGNKGGQIEQFDPSNQPKAMQKWER